METTRRIDAYCERTGPEFWSEPLNAVTNAAFILAALTALALASRRGRPDPAVVALSGVLGLIGLGSFLFHTFATAWAAVLDVAPIMAFIVGYFAIAMHRFMRLRWSRAIFATFGFVAAAAAFGSLIGPALRPLIGSSAGYVPALLGLAAVGGWLAARPDPRQQAAGRHLITAAVLFTVSLTFRVLDGPLCPEWPHGTHFLWHLMNATVLFTALRALIRHGAPEPALAAPGDPR